MFFTLHSYISHSLHKLGNNFIKKLIPGSVLFGRKILEIKIIRYLKLFNKGVL